MFCHAAGARKLLRRARLVPSFCGYVDIPVSGPTFEMRYTDESGEARVLHIAAERLWEAVERADAKFCRPMTPADAKRFQRALAIGRGEEP